MLIFKNVCTKLLLIEYFTQYDAAADDGDDDGDDEGDDDKWMILHITYMWALELQM